jgi:hypothetical protein
VLRVCVYLSRERRASRRRKMKFIDWDLVELYDDFISITNELP